MLTRLFIALILGLTAKALLDYIPAAWSLDYDEIPRIPAQPYGLPALSVPVFSLLLYFAPDYFICICLIEIAVSDCRYQILPDQWILALGIYALFAGEGMLGGRVRAAGAALLLWFLAALPAALLSRAPAFGFGDAKLFFALALALGGRGALFLCAAACLAAGPAALAAALSGKRRLPFAPFVLVCYVFFTGQW